ncbi:MAG TPA: c(7)-type cytochrome triheme domain-containing protein [Nitrospiria bacterium]|nr:c(7)-type cytochrome triheme domain-containing protein [Nitrospiria bacterium]
MTGFRHRILRGSCIALMVTAAAACSVSPFNPQFPNDQPAQSVALEYLPNTPAGYIDWVAALQKGPIRPKESLDPEIKTPVTPPLDLNIVFKIDRRFPLNNVVFPHFPHTQWLDCNNCHPAIFIPKAGANAVSMNKIFKGEFCGRCHGKVSFPLFDCGRCHSGAKG